MFGKDGAPYRYVAKGVFIEPGWCLASGIFWQNHVKIVSHSYGK